jgi:hypothetical protein
MLQKRRAWNRGQRQPLGKELQSAEKPGQHGSFAGPIASIAGKKELHSAELTANGIRGNGRKA